MTQILGSPWTQAGHSGATPIALKRVQEKRTDSLVPTPPLISVSLIHILTVGKMSTNRLNCRSDVSHSRFARPLIRTCISDSSLNY
jgi:hypothetical protein